MQSYLGRMSSTALPRSSNSRLRPNATSASPPTLATGANSGVIMTMNMAGTTGGGGDVASAATSTVPSGFALGSSIRGNTLTISSSEMGSLTRGPIGQGGSRRTSVRLAVTGGVSSVAGTADSRTDLGGTVGGGRAGRPLPGGANGRAG